jgi:hypothetical protein
MSERVVSLDPEDAIPIREHATDRREVSTTFVFFNLIPRHSQFDHFLSSLLSAYTMNSLGATKSPDFPKPGLSV